MAGHGGGLQVQISGTRHTFGVQSENCHSDDRNYFYCSETFGNFLRSSPSTATVLCPLDLKLKNLISVIIVFVVYNNSFRSNDCDFMSLDETSPNARRSRSILSQNQVIEIFGWKFTADYASGKVRAAVVAKQYGVTAKAVRDIWVGRTWYRETHHLDPSRPDTAKRLMRKIGRPKGARDLKPRTKKIIDGTSKSRDEISCDKLRKLQLAELAAASLHLASNSSLPVDSRARMDATEYVLSEELSANFADPFHGDWPYWERSMGSEEFQVADFL